ncbi:MAG: YraN family protein [Acidobacteriaceae bacterium]|nr:YraN family protein [Acidobacteriaceae bacterium]MBV9778690.1 YraN family protein [Acidobacteriaceae bacterium]
MVWKLSDSARQIRERYTLSADSALGRRGEDLAHRYLRSAGFTVVARNYRPTAGDAEVDIIARDNGTLVFIEVKSRASAEFGSPDRAIDSEKQKHIVRAARSYATRAGVPWNEVRFDTISIVFTKPPSIIHQQDAFFDGRAF